MRNSQEWVIWGVNKNKEITFSTRTCKEPAMVKEYKSLRKQFSEGEVNKYGYMTYTEYEKSNYWLDCEIQYLPKG